LFIAINKREPRTLIPIRAWAGCYGLSEDGEIRIILRMSEKRSVGIRELQRDTSEIVERVTRTGRPTFVTNRGETVAVVYPVDADVLEAYALANAPEFVRSMTEADAALVEGRTRPAREVIGELADEPPRTTRTWRAAAGEGLTAREVEVLHRVAEGMTNKQIAEELSISPTTVRRHLNVILRKLGASRRASAVSARAGSD
jgi:prevent-host-death family protein